MVLIDYISQKISNLNSIDKQLGAVIFSFNFSSGGSGGGTKIYDSFDIVDSLHPFVKAIRNFNQTQKNPDAFKIFFRNLRFSDRIDDSGTFVKRRKFFRELLLHKKIDWKLIEEFITVKAQEKKDGAPKFVVYLKPFIQAILKELKLSEQTEFENTYNLGYRIGKHTSKIENENFGKSFLYLLKKSPNPDRFLETLNTLQTRTQSLIGKDDVQRFSESQKLFRVRKTQFLIGYCNAIFSRNFEKTKS